MSHRLVFSETKIDGHRAFSIDFFPLAPETQHYHMGIIEPQDVTDEVRDAWCDGLWAAFDMCKTSILEVTPKDPNDPR